MRAKAECLEHSPFSTLQHAGQLDISNFEFGATNGSTLVRGKNAHVGLRENQKQKKTKEGDWCKTCRFIENKPFRQKQEAFRVSPHDRKMKAFVSPTPLPFSTRPSPLQKKKTSESRTSLSNKCAKNVSVKKIRNPSANGQQKRAPILFAFILSNKLRQRFSIRNVSA